MRLAATLLLGLTVVTVRAASPAADVPSPRSQRPPFAAEADSVMASFVRVWEQRDALAYDDLLADDFVFGFRPQPPREHDPPIEVLERARELQMAERLFGREAGRRDDGSQLSPVQTIHLWLRPQDEWNVAREPEHAGTVRRLYLVELTLETEHGERVQVRGIQEFFVRTGHGARAAKLQGWNEPAAWQVGPTYVGGPTLGDVKLWYASSDRDR